MSNQGGADINYTYSYLLLIKIISMQNFGKKLKDNGLLKSNVLLFLLVLGIFSACQNDEIPAEATEYSHDDIAHVLCHQNQDCALELLEDGVVMDGDMVFTNEQLAQLIEEGFEEKKDHVTFPMTLDGDDEVKFELDQLKSYDQNGDLLIDQRHRIRPAYLVSTAKTHITFHILPSVLNDCGQDWVNAIHYAAQSYNDLPGTTINFSYRSNPNHAELLIGSNRDVILPYNVRTLSPTAIAKARVGAVGNNPGEYIAINHLKDNHGPKTATIIHEFGHILGLYHTNSKSGNFYLGTSATAPSIFASSRGGNTYFTDSDKHAIRILWPSSLKKPTNFSANKSLAYPGNVVIRLKNPKPDDRPYEAVAVGHFINGQLEEVRVWWDQPNSAGAYTITWLKNFTPGDDHQFIARAFAGGVGRKFSPFSAVSKKLVF